MVYRYFEAEGRIPLSLQLMGNRRYLLSRGQHQKDIRPLVVSFIHMSLTDLVNQTRQIHLGSITTAGSPMSRNVGYDLESIQSKDGVSFL